MSTRLRTAVSWTVAVALLGAAAIVVLLWIQGGRWMMIESPSMGRALPVGTLVVTAPTAPAELRVGDVISFRPSGANVAMHTHRIVAIGRGTVTTKGDINGASDSAVPVSRVVGRVVWHASGLGWIITALPVLAVGTAIVLVATRLWLRPPLRVAARLAGIPIVVAIASLVYHPFIGVATLASQAVGAALRVSVVSTGLLPSRVMQQDGPHVDLVAGQVGSLYLRSHLESGRIPLVVFPHLSIGWWLGILAVCCLPLVAALPRIARRSAWRRR
jgi:signal peptidase I